MGNFYCRSRSRNHSAWRLVCALQAWSYRRSGTIFARCLPHRMQKLTFCLPEGTTGGVETQQVEPRYTVPHHKKHIVTSQALHAYGKVRYLKPVEQNRHATKPAWHSWSAVRNRQLALLRGSTTPPRNAQQRAVASMKTAFLRRLPPPPPTYCACVQQNIGTNGVKQDFAGVQVTTCKQDRAGVWHCSAPG